MLRRWSAKETSSQRLSAASFIPCPRRSNPPPINCQLAAKINDRAQLPYELVSPLDNLSSWSRTPCSPCLGHNALLGTRQSSNNLASPTSLVLSACGDDIVLVATPLHRSFFATFAKEHFDADITFAASRQISDTFVVGSFHQQVTHGKTGNRQIDAVKR